MEGIKNITLKYTLEQKRELDIVKKAMGSNSWEDFFYDAAMRYKVPFEEIKEDGEMRRDEHNTQDQNID